MPFGLQTPVSGARGLDGVAVAHQAVIASLQQHVVVQRTQALELAQQGLAQRLGHGVEVAVVDAPTLLPADHVAHDVVRARIGGIGAGLVRAAQIDARNTGIKALTLTTFRDVAWNAPFYARLGFAASHEGMKLQL